MSFSAGDLVTLASGPFLGQVARIVEMFADGATVRHDSGIVCHVAHCEMSKVTEIDSTRTSPAECAPAAPLAATPDAIEPGLPHSAKARKATPVASGVLAYFPDAIAEVAKVSFIGNEQHNPGEPLHWARGKSMDQLDAAVRHVMDYLKGDRRDDKGNLVLAQAAWRILAQAQLDLEAAQKGSSK